MLGIRIYKLIFIVALYGCETWSVMRTTSTGGVWERGAEGNIQSHVTTDDQSLSPSWFRGPLGLMIGYWLLFDIYCFVDVGRPPWREVGAVICLSRPSYWLTAKLLLALASVIMVASPTGLMTIFYCLTALGAFRPLGEHLGLGVSNGRLRETL
jgi:hypothetical protein